jgi:hypothetical protein
MSLAAEQGDPATLDARRRAEQYRSVAEASLGRQGADNTGGNGCDQRDRPQPAEADLARRQNKAREQQDRGGRGEDDHRSVLPPGGDEALVRGIRADVGTLAR